MVIRKCDLLSFANKDIIVYEYILALRVIKRHTLLVLRLVCLILILNTISTNIFFPLGKIIGMVRSRTRFIMSSRTPKIGSPLTDGARRNCLVSCPHRSYTFNPFIKNYPHPQSEHCQCVLIVRYILMKCNHLVQTKDTFVRRDVVDSFIFYLTECQFYAKL